MPELFNLSAGSYPTYPEPFRQSLLEQYKLCLQSADAASGRREASNRYLITLNVALVALYGLQSTGKVMDEIGRAAESRGLTPEILETLLCDK